MTSMARELTECERKQVAAYIRANPMLDSKEIAAHFTDVLGTPVTDHCILRTMVVSALGGYR